MLVKLLNIKYTYKSFMNRGKRKDIQALRAIAVLAVVIYHFWPGRITGGFMGVDIFFVISGYLMTATLMRDAHVVTKSKQKLKATGSFLVNFYARRIKRLIPAASVTLLGTLGLVFITGNLSLIQETARQITASSLFYQNWFLANNSVDYLANTDPTAVQHFWSLSLEEQFYLVWPLLLLVLLLVTSSLYIGYRKKQLISFAVLPTTLLIVGFFIYGYLLTKEQPSLAYFVTPARVWELLLGGLLAFLPVLKNYDLRLLLPWVGSAMIGYALYVWDGTNFPGWHALVPTLGTALIIYAGGLANDSKWSFENILRYRPIQWLGDISYSLYLWHWPLIILLPVLFFVDLDAHPQSILIKLSILLLSLILAHLSYRFVESSTQHKEIKKRYVFSGFFIIVALVAGLSSFVANRAEASTNNAIQDINTAVINDDNLCIGAKSVLNSCEKSFGYINPGYIQTAANDKYDRLLLSDEVCASYDGRKYRKNIGDWCIVGDVDAKREITIWGDSHTQHWINPMDKIGRKNNLKVNIIGTSYCFGSDNPGKNCSARFDMIRESGVLENSESIIISMLQTTKGGDVLNALQPLKSFTNNRNIYVLEDVPSSGPDGGPDCYQLRQSCKNNLSDATNLITQNSVSLVEAGEVEADNIIEVKDFFCDDSYCYSNIGGIPVYRDKSIGSTKTINSHMTASFAYSTWPILEVKFKDASIIKQSE